MKIYTSNDDILSISNNGSSPSDFFSGPTMDQNKKERFELLTSSLKKIKSDCSLEDAKKFAKDDLCKHLTPIPDGLKPVSELEKNQGFCFLARVDTSGKGDYDLSSIANQALNRKYLSFSIVTEKNISHYRTKYPFLMVYNMASEGIAHIFPIDSDTNVLANSDNEVSPSPSLWLSYDEIESLTNEIGTYNQVTCKTSVDGKPTLPAAILVFDKLNESAEEVASRLGLPIIIAHPQKDAICFTGDIYDFKGMETVEKLRDINAILRKKFIRCFKTKHEKELLNEFLSSLNMGVDLEMMLKMISEKI